MRFTIPRGYSSRFMQIRMFLDSDYIEKYIPKKKFVICYAGTINSNNPIDVLIEAEYY
jgi:hypothetical protein